MASASLLGTNAGFKYSPSGSEVVHRLAYPLLDIDAPEHTTAFEVHMLDGKTRKTVRLVDEGDEVNSIVASIRFENQPEALKMMLRASRLNHTALHYHADLDGAALFTAEVWRVVGEQFPGHIPLQRDPDRYMFQEWMVRVELRRTDGNDFSALIEAAS